MNEGLKALGATLLPTLYTYTCTHACSEQQQTLPSDRNTQPQVGQAGLCGAFGVCLRLGRGEGDRIRQPGEQLWSKHTALCLPKPSGLS